MDLSEEQIKDILQHTQTKIDPDPQLEDIIMMEIKAPNHYESLIQKSQWYAKTSLWASMIISACLIVSLCYRLYSKPPLPVNGLEQLLPSLAVVIMLFILTKLLYFSTNWGTGVGGRKVEGAKS